MNLSKLLLVHAVLTFAAGVVLLIAPGAIPQSVGIDLDQRAYLLSYLLGAAEMSVAFLSYFGRTLRDVRALRLLSQTFVAFHLLSAMVEIYAFAQGANAVILTNVGIRILAAALFAYYGIYVTIHET